MSSCHCVTCSDEGLPMTVVAVDERRVLALCEGEDGGRASVEIALVEPVVADLDHAHRDRDVPAGDADRRAAHSITLAFSSSSSCV